VSKNQIELLILSYKIHSKKREKEKRERVHHYSFTKIVIVTMYFMVIKTATSCSIYITSKKMICLPFYPMGKENKTNWF